MATDRPWTVAVPTYKRAGMVSTDWVVRGCKIVCPESQAEEYREREECRNGAEVYPCPDEVDGNVARKRNWILDEFPGRVLLLDDDLRYLGRFYQGEVTTLDLDAVDEFLENGFRMAEELGTVMWGVNQQADPKFYREYTPFCFLSPILGPFQGFCDTPLRYDEDLWLKEDYDMWLQTVHRYHRTLRFNQYHYMANHLDQPGGCVSHRTMAEERRQVERLQKKWGKDVVRIRHDQGTINPKINVPLKGV